MFLDTPAISFVILQHIVLYSNDLYNQFMQPNSDIHPFCLPAVHKRSVLSQILISFPAIFTLLLVKEVSISPYNIHLYFPPDYPSI